jgi:threonine aldolase
LQLQNALAQLPELVVDDAHTNMLYIEFSSLEIATQAGAFLREHGILISVGKRVRLVTHLDIKAADIERFVALLKQFFMH